MAKRGEQNGQAQQWEGCDLASVARLQLEQGEQIAALRKVIAELAEKVEKLTGQKMT